MTGYSSARLQQVQSMTVLASAAELCRELDKRHIGYQLQIARYAALMVSVAVPGERWEIEFFADGHVELERFVSQGVADAPAVRSELLSLLDE
jgi:hypothetical protein